jgi:uroporphyrinogen-III synthase
MRLLVTRPLDDGLELAERLSGLGHEALVEPLLSIAPDLAAALPLAGATALLFTSANGVRAFALRSQERGLPVFAVGAATARAAREVGFADITSAEGDAAALEALVLARRKPADGPLLHVAGKVVAGDLAGRLVARGFEVRTAALYAAEPALRLSDAARDALAQGEVDGALVFSPRSAAILVGLVEAAGLRAAAARLDLYALSEAVAAAASGLAWRRVVVAAAPNEDAMLAALAPVAGPARAEEKMQAAQEPRPPSSSTVAARAWRLLPAGAALLALGALALAFHATNEASRHAAREDALAARLARAEAELAAPRALPREVPALADRATRIEAALARLSEATTAQASRLAVLERELRQDIEAARAAAQPSPDAARDTGAATAALAAVAAENQRLAAEIFALRDELSRLSGAREVEARLAEERRAEEQRAAGRREDGDRATRLGAAVAALRAVLSRGGDAGAELAALRALASGQPRLAAALAQVEAQLAATPPTLEALRASLPGLAAAALRAARATNPSPGWWDAALARLSALAAVRRVGEVEGEDAEALLARAERRLEAGELAAAIDLVARLAGPAAPVLAPWLAQARARAALDDALATLARAAAAPG